jgi:hypothetical protein
VLDSYNARVAEEGEYDDEELPPDVLEALEDKGRAHFAVRRSGGGAAWAGAPALGRLGAAPGDLGPAPGTAGAWAQPARSGLGSTARLDYGGGLEPVAANSDA